MIFDMFKTAEQVAAERPRGWHQRFIVFPRFVRTDDGTGTPEWRFVMFQNVIRRSVGRDDIAGFTVHYWQYRLVKRTT